MVMVEGSFGPLLVGSASIILLPGGAREVSTPLSPGLAAQANLAALGPVAKREGTSLARRKSRVQISPGPLSLVYYSVTGMHVE